MDLKRTTRIGLWTAAVAALVLLILRIGIPGGGGPGRETAGTDYPGRPITLLVPYAAGGGTDATARALATATEKVLGQPVIVVNRTGGGGSVGLMEGANAKGDGYTVTFCRPS